MLPSKCAVELCALLVDEAYGELTSRIFTILLRRGRLPIRLLAKHTLLTPRQLRHGLAVLIQQGLVYHNSSDEAATLYEANDNAAYSLARAGKIMEMAGTRFGSSAKDVVQLMFLLGHASVFDLVAAYTSKKASSESVEDTVMTNGTNGDRPVPTDFAAQVHGVLKQLLDAGFVEPVVKSMLQSPTDTYNKVEKEILSSSFSGGTKGAKQKQELEHSIRQHLRSIREERAWKNISGTKLLNGEYTNGVNGTNKRKRLQNGNSASDSLEDDGTRLEPTLIVRINYDRWNVAIRNVALVNFAKSRIGEISSLIYAQGLKLLERKVLKCKLDPAIDDKPDKSSRPSGIFTTKELAAALNKSIDPRMGIGKASELAKANASRKNKSKGNNDHDMGGLSDDEPRASGRRSNMDDDHAVNDRLAKRAKVTFEDSRPEPLDDSDNRIELIKIHLAVLAGDGAKFLIQCGQNGYGEWTCDFDQVIRKMQEDEVDAMLMENFGSSGHRLGRMLRLLGKYDEKQLADMAKYKLKDVRTKLAEMQMAGIVDIQEVPRDGNRTVNRTIFLWFFDEDRATTMVLERTYKAMSRAIQILDIERRRAHDVLALTERSDVRDLDPELYLDAGQLNDFREIDGKVDRILCQVGRLDGLVGLFRDF